MKFRGKGINLQAVVECFCYLIFSVLLFRLTASGKYLNYVTPRMKPYLYGLSFLMLLWAVAEGRHLLTPRYKVRLSRTFVLVIPILLLLGPKPTVEGSSMIRNYDNSGLTGIGNMRKTGYGGSSQQDYGAGYGDSNQQAPAAGYGGSDQQDYGAGYGDSNQQAPAAGYGGSDQQDYGAGYGDSNQQAPAAGYGGSDQQAPAAGYADPKNNLLKSNADLKGLDEAAKTITISDEDYYSWMVELGTNPQKYEGYTVIAKGFIYRDSEVVKNCNFALVRLSMWCCSADLMPLGFMIDYGGQLNFKDNDWVVVTGTLSLGADGSIHLKASDIKAGSKPKEEYVYPY